MSSIYVQDRVLRCSILVDCGPKVSEGTAEGTGTDIPYYTVYSRKGYWGCY